MTLGFDFIGGGLGASSALATSIITSLTDGLSKPSFHPVYNPSGLPAVSECLPEMINIFLEKLRFITDCFSPVGKCINYTIICRYVMITVPM